MFFNGFTLFLMMLAAFGGFLWGMRYENRYQRDRYERLLNAESIEKSMQEDGWYL